MHYNDANGSNDGHVRIYELYGASDNSWTQLGAIMMDGAKMITVFAVSLSPDGIMVAIGYYNDSGSNEYHVRVYELWME